MVGLERLLIGRTLGGRYAVEELIGRGRGGLVYRARDEEAGAEVALKVLAAPQSAEGRERYRRLVAGEVGVAAALGHPNVVAVHRWGRPSGPDFVTSSARGRSGRRLAQRGKRRSAGLTAADDSARGSPPPPRGLLHREVRTASLYRCARGGAAGSGEGGRVRRSPSSAASRSPRATR